MIKYVATLGKYHHSQYLLNMTGGSPVLGPREKQKTEQIFCVQVVYRLTLESKDLIKL